MRYAVIIPARYKSSRLPGKPLVSIAGVPMIIRTYRQCLKAIDSDKVWIATDDERIARVCSEHSIQVMMTSPDCLTGTDRVAEAAAKLDVDFAINVQGDEPVFNPSDLKDLLSHALADPNRIFNGFCALSDEAQWRSLSVPKVVVRPDGRLLYMSRSPIPGNKSARFIKGWRQVCMYSFPVAALEEFSRRNSKTDLEELEDIEILRFLEMGWDVHMIPMSADSVAVDNPEDVLVAEQAVVRLGL